MSKGFAIISLDSRKSVLQLNTALSLKKRTLNTLLGAFQSITEYTKSFDATPKFSKNKRITGSQLLNCNFN